MAHLSTTILRSPLGPLNAVADGDTVVGLYFDGHHPAPRGRDRWQRDAVPFSALASALDEYFAGEREAFDDIAVRLDGSTFQRAVWDALRAIPYGSTASYAELAARLGRPRAARAVGAANARNPVSIVVPCHRLVARNGGLAGYAGGEWRKRFLLDLEAT